MSSPMHRMDVRLKMTIGFAMSMVAILVDSLLMLGAGAVIGALLFAACRPTRGQSRLVIFSFTLLVWGMIFSQALFYQNFPRHAILSLLPPNVLMPEGLQVYAEGIRHGLVQSLRLIMLGLTGYAICFSTEPGHFLQGLLAIRVPFGLAFMAVTAIRFLPIFATEYQAVRLAMRLKGYRPLRRGVRDTIRTEISSLRPVLLGAIRRAQEIALSIQTRGFVLGAPRSSLVERRFGAGQWLTVMMVALLIGALLVCKLLFLLYQYQLFYVPALRPLYAFVRAWL